MNICRNHDIVYVEDECPACKLEDKVRELQDKIEMLEEARYETPAEAILSQESIGFER